MKMEKCKKQRDLDSIKVGGFKSFINRNCLNAKRILLFSMFSTSLFLIACGNNEETTMKETDNPVQEEQPKEEASVGKDISTQEEQTNKEGSEEKDTNETSEDNSISSDWKEVVKKIALSNKSESEKVEEVKQFGNDYYDEYQPSSEELEQFLQYIIGEYNNGKYKNDIKNHEYMINNLFQAHVASIPAEYGEPLNEFLSKFFFTTIEIYTGKESVDSAYVNTNEGWMNRYLKEMQ